MNKRAIIIGLIVLLIVVGVVIVLLPNETRAPTQNSTSIGTATGTSPTPAAQPAQTAASLPDLITVDAPLPQEKIASPLTISGKARGSWYFEASAPVELKDSSGTVIAHGTLHAQGDWMTQEYVPFTATLTFTAPATPTGTLILKNDNPSGDPGRQKELDIPIQF